MSWTNIIFSDRIRSIGGKSSMNLSIFLFLSCSSSREPGRKKLYVLIRSKWVFFSDLIRNESELRLVCVGLILFQFLYCHFATVNWIENFASLPFFNGSFSERRLNGRVFCHFTTCWGLKWKFAYETTDIRQSPMRNKNIYCSKIQSVRTSSEPHIPLPKVQNSTIKLIHLRISPVLLKSFSNAYTRETCL